MTASLPAAAALHFAAPPPDAPLFGLAVAVETLYDAFLRHARQPHLICHGRSDADFAAFRQRAIAARVDLGRLGFIASAAPAALAETGALLVPDPDIAAFAAARDTAGPRAWSLIGLSHTMTGAQVVQAVARCRAAPMQPWDAIICPSRAIRAAIEALWQMVDRDGDPCPVRLPTIPLGVDAARFAAVSGPTQRQAQRARLHIPEDAVVVLFHGRLSHWAKAHPLPLLLAAERVAANTATPLHLAFFGYFPSDAEGVAFRALAADVCRRAQVHFVDNADPAFPDACWAAADIFASLVDNVQESFGLTPVEAMAAGLPVLASDWNGYRDTVRHGREGFLVPTLAAAPGDGSDLAQRYAAGEDTYGEHLAAAAQSTAVDIAATTASLARLVADTDLRRQMGEAGRRRVAAVYDWPRVIAAYEDLFGELADIRRSAAAARPSGKPFPATAAPDPFAMFRAFPARGLGPTDRLRAAPDAVVLLTRLLRHRISMPAPWALIAPERLAPLLGHVAGEPGIAVAALAARLGIASASEDGSRLRRTLVWLVKLGALSAEPTCSATCSGR